MDKVVITILQGSVFTQTVLRLEWANYISSSYKFHTDYMCQKLWKLVGSRQKLL